MTSANPLRIVLSQVCPVRLVEVHGYKDTRVHASVLELNREELASWRLRGQHRVAWTVSAVVDCSGTGRVEQV